MILCDEIRLKTKKRLLKRLMSAQAVSDLFDEIWTHTAFISRDAQEFKWYFEDIMAPTGVTREELDELISD